jgi:hypothetical protein
MEILPLANQNQTQTAHPHKYEASPIAKETDMATHSELTKFLLHKLAEITRTQQDLLSKDIT